jgi:hypothetical protein
MKIIDSPPLYPSSSTNPSFNPSSLLSVFGLVFLAYGFSWLPALLAGFLYFIETLLYNFLVNYVVVFRTNYFKVIFFSVTGGIAGYLGMVFFEFLLSSGRVTGPFHHDIWKTCSGIAGMACGVIAGRSSLFKQDGSL